MKTDVGDVPDLLSEALIAEIDRAAVARPVDGERLQSLCLELEGRLQRGDLMLGLLPPDAPEVMARGFAAAGAAGHPESWLHLGRAYETGWVGEPVDWPSPPSFPDDPDDDPDAAALRCFAEAAATGHRRAAIAFAATSRECSEQARQVALSFLQPLLADDADGQATYWYGIVQYLLGHPADAVATQHRAAGLGNAEAMFELYVLYVKGDGVDHDDTVARQWLLRAADREHHRALYNIGAFHATGRDGFEQDDARAVAFYERAARAGNAQAAGTLGVMYLTGDMVEVDRDEAASWLDLAEEKGLDVDDWLDRFGLERPE